MVSFVLFWVQLAAAEPLFEEATALLTAFNPERSNVTRVVELLELSAARDTPQAFTALGELHLFGLPAAFSRDLDKAVRYFQAARALGDGDAAFYLLFLQQQARLVPALARLALDEEATLYAEGLQRRSGLVELLSVANYLECMNAQAIGRIPTLVNTIDYIDQETCGGDCESLAFGALSSAWEALAYFQRKGSADVLPEDLYADQHNFKGTENHLLLYSKVSSRSIDFLALAENYMFGNLALGVHQDVELALEYYTSALPLRWK